MSSIPIILNFYDLPWTGALPLIYLINLPILKILPIYVIRRIILKAIIRESQTLSLGKRIIPIILTHWLRSGRGRGITSIIYTPIALKIMNSIIYTPMALKIMNSIIGVSISLRVLFVGLENSIDSYLP